MKRLTLLTLTLLAAGANAEPMSKGEYVARAGDCMACHTTENGAPLAGGLKFATPLGAIYSTNITPDKNHGIGAYRFDEFARAMRDGVAKDGHRLYPAMPYPSYAKMNDEDLRALYDYLMNEVKPQPAANRESDIPWPLSLRCRWPPGTACLLMPNLLRRERTKTPPGTGALIWCRARATAAPATRHAARRCRKKRLATATSNFLPAPNWMAGTLLRCAG